MYKYIIFAFLVSGISAELLYQGDNCTVDSEIGMCTLLEDCPSAKQKLRLGLKPKNCGFEGNHPIVCCFPIKLNLGKPFDSLHEEKCKEFYDETQSNIAKDNEIPANGFVGGLDALPGQFPHMAQLGK